MTTTTKRRIELVASVALLSAIAFTAEAQGPSDKSLEVTITLLPENAVGPADATRDLVLPPAVANAGAPPEDPSEGPPPGADRGEGQGLETATEARERGREFGQEVAEQARENRENAGRPDDAGPPNNLPLPPDRPSPPDQPGPPVTPPGRP